LVGQTQDVFLVTETYQLVNKYIQYLLKRGGVYSAPFFMYNIKT
jgi:hypothetical protein